jgi:hypothetical protein
VSSTVGASDLFLCLSVYPAGHPADAEDTTWQYDAAENRELETIGADPAIDYVPNCPTRSTSTRASAVPPGATT